MFTKGCAHRVGAVLVGAQPTLPVVDNPSRNKKIRAPLGARIFKPL